MKNYYYKILKATAIIGIILLCINIYGLFRSLGNDSIYSEEHTLFENDIDINARALLEEVLHEEKITNREVYFQKLVKAVNKNIAHYWRSEGRTDYNLTIPIYENYFLWTEQFITPKRYKYYEFCDYKRALERKVGLCSQQAIIVCGILEDKHIPAKIVGLSGHVVTEAEVKEGHYWILDADYGVIVPESIKQIEKDPSIIFPYYKGKMNYNQFSISQKQNNPIPLNRLVEIYGNEGNIVVDGVKGYCGDNYDFEEMTFYLIWIIPVVLILPFIILRMKYIRN